MRETAPKCCLVLSSPGPQGPPLADGAMPGPSPPGHCAATHPPETHRGDIDTRKGRQGGRDEGIRVGGGEADTHRDGEREAGMSPRLERRKPSGGSRASLHHSQHPQWQGGEKPSHQPESKARNWGSREAASGPMGKRHTKLGQEEP